MLKIKQSYENLIERAKSEVEGFKEEYEIFEREMTIRDYSKSCFKNYGRSVANISLYFNKRVTELDAEKVNEYLFHLTQKTNLAITYYKHVVYGLRFFLGSLI